jgi:uncharacterized protein with von Willebrand factor type A (vWA) domain
LHNNAFLNKKSNKFPKEMRKVISPSKNKNKIKKDEERHPIGTKDYEDRNKCKENFLNHIKEGKKINAAVSDLHKIVESYFNRGAEKGEDDPIYEAQWKKRIEEVRALRSGNSPLSIFSLVDLSGSMAGQPLMVAITLGIFLSELLDDPNEVREPSYANKFMTFSATPVCMKLPRGTSLRVRINEMKKYMDSRYWGGNTNITLAISEILKIAKENKLTQEQLPKMLAIFSDMQFDVADGSFSLTSYQATKKQFEDLGYTIPIVLFWNLRSSPGFQVPANKPNTIMLSGYTTRLFDLLLEGNLEELKEISTAASLVQQDAAVKTPITSIIIMEKAIGKMDEVDPTLTPRFLEALKKDLQHSS